MSLSKELIREIERNLMIGSTINGMKVVSRDKHGTVVHLGGDSFKILHNGKNQNVFGNPLIGDPIFGYETLGTLYVRGIGNTISGSIFTCPENGTAQSVTIGLQNKFAAVYTGKIKSAIYTGVLVGSTPVAITEERTLTLTAYPVWYTFNLLPPTLVSAATAYALVSWGQKIDTTMAGIACDEGAGIDKSVTYNGFPASIDWATNAYVHSIYCTYSVPSKPKGTIAVHAKLAGII